MDKVTEKTFPLYDGNKSTENLFWTEKERKQLLETPVFNVNSIVRRSTDGREGSFVEIATPRWVNIVPAFTGTDGKRYFVMERQFRHGSAGITLEFPAGLVEEDEEPESAALRELWEETGIRAGKLTRIGVLNPNSAFMCTRGYFFIAGDLDFTGERHLDANEQIDVVTVPASKVFSEMGTGEMDNGIMVMSVFLYLKEKNKLCVNLS